MMSKPRRPKPIAVTPLRARAQRYHKEKGWYWNVVTKGRNERSVWTGYATRGDVERHMVDLVASGMFDRDRDEDIEDGPIETVADLLSVWLGSHIERREAGGSLAASTAEKYLYSAGHLKRLIGTVQLLKLDGSTLDDYARIRRNEVARGKAGRGGKPTSLRTIQLEHVTMKAAWRWGIEQGLCPNRRLKPQRLKPPERDMHVPTRAEIARVLQELDGWLWLAVRIQVATGARIGEVCSLRIADVDPEQGVIRFPDGKTGAREVPIAPEAADIVRDWIATVHADKPPSAPLVRSHYPTIGSAASGRLRGACGRANVPPFTTHAIRYRAVLDMLDAGIDPKTASEITGHSIDTMLRIYRKVSTSTKRDAILRAKLGHLPAAPGQVIDFNRGGEG